ncbi:PAS domain-containing protein, partial [Alkalibacillus salilacus]
MSDQDEIVPETLSLEAYRSIVAYNPDSVLVVSIDKTIIEVNNRATELLGYSKESLVNQSFHSLFENEDRINQLFGDVRQGYSGEEELVVHLKNGGATHLSIKYMPMFQQDALIGVFIVLRDISTLYQTHESLQYTKNMFESLFHHTSNAIESFDMQGIVVDINPAFERIFGWQRQEVIGKPSLFQAWLHDMSDEFDALTDYNATITTKHDEKITVNLAISPIIDRHDNITGYTVVARDVTKQKQLQEQLSESEERYRLVAENTLDV